VEAFEGPSWRGAWLEKVSTKVTWGGERRGKILTRFIVIVPEAGHP